MKLLAGPLWRLIDCAVTARANRAKVPVNRKAYLRWFLLGVFGAQRFWPKLEDGLALPGHLLERIFHCHDNDRRNDRRADETGRKRHHLPVKTSSLRRPAGCCFACGAFVDSGKQRMLAKFQGNSPAQYAEKQLLLLAIISGKIAFHFRADMLN